jgi:hypothetical protein
MNKTPAVGCNPGEKRVAESGVGFFARVMRTVPPSLQCIVAAFPKAMHMLSTGLVDGLPRNFRVSERPVQV